MATLALDIVLIVVGLALAAALVTAAVQRRSRVGPFPLGVLLAAAVAVSLVWLVRGYG